MIMEYIAAMQAGKAISNFAESEEQDVPNNLETYSYQRDIIIEKRTEKFYTVGEKLEKILLFIPSFLIEFISTQLAIILFNSRRSLEKTAEGGDIEAQYRLGDIYTEGILVYQDFDEALRWYSIASDSGHSGAKYKIGMLYEKGFGVPKDKAIAMKWFEEAAKLKNIKAQITLAIIHDSDEAYIDNKKAIKWYKKAALKGHPIAQNNLAIRYEKKGNYKEALKWLKKSAERGELIAKNNLGRYYKEGIGVKKDIEKAKEWYLLSAKKGYKDSQYELGNIYYSEGDIDLAKIWLKSAAKQNQSTAQYKLGILNCQRKNFKKSKAWLKKASKQNSIMAKYMLGKSEYMWNMYNLETQKILIDLFREHAEEGDISAQHAIGQVYERGYAGIKQNYKQAIKWYKKAADQDYDRAQYNLAVLYEKGLGVKKNIDKALKLYKRAGQQGNTAAKLAYKGEYEDWSQIAGLFYNPDIQYLAGNKMFIRKIRKKKKGIKSIQWYWEQASKKENQYAQYNLGRLYMLGIEIDKDYVNAYKWLFLSNKNGVAKAGKKLEYLKKLMSKEQIEKADAEILLYKYIKYL